MWIDLMPGPVPVTPEKSLLASAPSENPPLVTVTDMTVADSNQRSVAFTNHAREFRPMECPAEGYYRNPDDCTRYAYILT